MQIAETAVQREAKLTRPKRGQSIPGMARKVAELATQTVQAALKEEARNTSDHARLLALYSVVFNGAFSTMLRNSTLLTAEDRAFLKELNYI
jgi:hypothetical protein